VRQRVVYARKLVAEGHSPSALARILQISRQATYRVPAKPLAVAARSRPPVDDVERAIIAVAAANPTDGYRIVTAWVQRRLGRAVNRKRVLRVMRERRLTQRRTHEPRRMVRYLKKRCVWRHEFETLEQARDMIGTYIEHYHDRPHSRLNYRTPREVKATWDDAQGALQNTAA
jgi:Integrase core domain/HTH-like domain